MLTCEHALSFLGTLFDLRFCIGLRASFVGLREPSIGLGNPHLAVLYRPERVFFRSQRTLSG